MKKRVISLLLAVVMTASMITGCGSSSGNDTESAESAEGAEGADNTAESEGSEVSISFYTTETGKDDMFQDVIADFEQKNPGITVEYIAAGDDQLQKWMSLYASNEGGNKLPENGKIYLIFKREHFKYAV